MTSPKTTIEAAKLSWIGRKSDSGSEVTRAVSPTPGQTPPSTRRASSPSRFRPSSPTALNSRSFGADSYQVEFLKSKSLAINTDTKDPNTDLVKSVADCDARCALTVGEHIWVGERDGNISVRRVLDGTVVHIIERRKGTYVFCLIEVGTQVWAGCSDGFIRVLSQSTYRLERQLARHAGGGAAVQCLAYHSASQTVFSGSNDFEILAWNAQTYTMVRQLAGHGAPVRALLVVSNYLYSGADDAAVMFWDIPSATRQGVWLGHTKGVHALAVSAQGHIWSGSEDGTIRIWNPANGETVGVGEVHTGAVNVLTTVGDKIWSGSGDTLCLWDAVNLRLVGTYVAHNGYVNAITIVQKATLYKVWTLGSDRNAKLWRTERHPDEGIVLTNKLAGMEELQYERDRLQEALKAREEEIKRLLIDLADSEERIRVLIPLEGLNATLRGDAAALLADNATLKAHAASLEVAVADLRDSHAKLLDDNTTLRTSILGSQRDAHTETYRAEIRALEATKAASQFQRDSDSLALQVQTLQLERQKLIDRIAAQEAEMDAMTQRLRDMDVVFKSRLSLITDVYKVYRKLETLEKQGKGSAEVTAVLGEFRGAIGKHFSDPELAHLGASRHFFPDETQQVPASPARRSHSPPLKSPTLTRSG